MEEGLQALRKELAGANDLYAKLTTADGPFPLVEEEVEHWGTTQRYKCFQKGPKYPNSLVMHTLQDLYADSLMRFADQEHIVYQDVRLTFGELIGTAAAFARGVAATFKIGKGDCVGIAGRNHHEWIISFVAATGPLTAVTLTVNSQWIGEELRYGLEDSQCKLLIGDPAILERAPFTVEMGIPTICMQHASATPPSGSRCFKDIVALGKTLPPLLQRPTSQIDTAILMYTSGTTNKPKGVVLTHKSVMTAQNALRLMRYPGDIAATSQFVALLGAPLFHVTASHVALLPSFWQGGKLVTMYRWDATEALKIIDKEKVASLVGVPTMTYELVNHPDFDKYDTSSLVGVGGGGAAFAASMIPRVNSKFKHARAMTGWGLTETNAITVVMPSGFFPVKPHSCGIPVRTCEVCALSEAGARLPANEVGELAVHSAHVMKEYWRKPDKTTEAFHFDGEGRLWFKTGDIGKVDEDGFIYIVDRAKDIIIRGGENISCAEVETAIYEHPAVAEVAAVGMPHPNLGETVAVAVVLKADVSPPTPDELREHARKRLAPFKVPQDVVLWNEPNLPRGATGKIQKRDIRDQLKGRLTPPAKL